MNDTTKPTIGIIYGSTNGATAEAALKIQQELTAHGLSTERHDILGTEVKTLERFDKLFLGCPTWHIGDLQDDWAGKKYKELATLNLTGKQAALFGTGDQYVYSDTFQDALGILAAELRHSGVELVGMWPTDGYEHTESKGAIAGKFLGLALDDDNQAKQTPGRIKAWVAQVVVEMNLKPELVLN